MINSKGQFVEIPVMDRITPHLLVANDGCWLWKKPLRKDKRYPTVKFKGRNTKASHIVLEHGGRLRPSLKHIACHSCDKPTCLNPSHLWWGTNKENSRDAVNKGRICKGIFSKKSPLECFRNETKRERGRRFRSKIDL
jgi:hypothetical protein